MPKGQYVCREAKIKATRPVLPGKRIKSAFTSDSGCGAVSCIIVDGSICFEAYSDESLAERDGVFYVGIEG
jgi:hypothetical protein